VLGILQIPIKIELRSMVNSNNKAFEFNYLKKQNEKMKNNYLIKR